MKIVNFKDKIVLSFYKLLKQGLSPVKLALVIALGMTLSVFPVLGTTTLICTLVALLFHLNLPAIQFSNYAAFPLPIILFFPFLKLGKGVSQVLFAPLFKAQFVATFGERLDLSKALRPNHAIWISAFRQIRLVRFQSKQRGTRSLTSSQGR